MCPSETLEDAKRIPYLRFSDKIFIQSTNSFSPTETLGNQSPLIDPKDLTVLPENEQLSVISSEDIVDYSNESMFHGLSAPSLTQQPEAPNSPTPSLVTLCGAKPLVPDQYFPDFTFLYHNLDILI